MGDLISRQAAIDAAKHAWAKGLEPSQYIEELPSAQTDLSEYNDKLWRNAYERGKRDVQQERRWIPCSERLPEEDDYKPFSFYEDGAVLFCTKNGKVGFGWYYESTKEWANEDDCTPGEVIAWMPLPEPYQEEEPECANGCLYGWHGIECEHCTLKGKQRGRAKDDNERD